MSHHFKRPLISEVTNYLASQIIMFLDIIHRPVFYLKHRPIYISKHNVSEIGFCIRLQVKPTQLGPIQLVPTNLRNIVFLK
jgi:hypothetical protein